MACTTEAQLVGTPDEKLSTEMQAPMASCLGLPSESVQILIDADRQVLQLEYARPEGFRPDKTDGMCFSELGLQGFAGQFSGE